MTLRVSLTIACILIFISSCSRPNRNDADIQEKATQDIEASVEKKKANKATYFIDNSGGMVGYVSINDTKDEVNNFILAVSDIVKNSDLRLDDVEVDYNLINGTRNIVRTPIGNQPQEYINCLNPTCFNQGDVSGNDLNAMFQIALDEANANNISFFVSDGIYDIQDKSRPETTIKSEGFSTRNKFIDRLVDENILTLLVKLESTFSGPYYYGITTDGIVINQTRPFYIFIFGNSELLNKYFDDQYLSNLSGYVNHTRFFKPTEYQVDYEPSTAYNKKGAFNPVNNDASRLSDVRSNQSGEFEFSIGVDYSSLPLSDNYLMNKDHYDVNGNFEVISVEKYTSSMFTNFTNFEPSHMITLRATGLPQGIININLLNNLPAWVKESHTDDDRNIEGNFTQTFGFEYLMQGIVDAYLKVSDKEYFTTITMTLNKN